ncbi:MAG: molybdopterin-dependent oxidoreductase [Candidatus Marinimicrobia bacterium]|nr:molybdopterin-dependent oxidoreductase [Candidatus Neomarinimicrobiota bacterium]
MSIQTHYRSCNLCEAICGLEIQTDNGSIVDIKGDAQDPLSRGHICPKAFALKDLHEDPDRLHYPIRKTDSGWQQISWKDALDDIAEKLCSIQDKYGQNAVGIYLGNPNVHNLGSMSLMPMMIKSLKTKNKFSATSVDQLPHMFASYFMFGHQFLIPIPDIDRTKYMLILGANPLVSNGSLMTVPDVRNRLKNIMNKGGKVVVIDPRKTETARIASDHCFIQPGADVYFLLSILYQIINVHKMSPGRLAEFTHNLDELESIVKSFPPEATAHITGIDAETVKTIAAEFCNAESAVCYGRTGVCTQEFGGTVHWLINVINIVTGNFDREGGAMFTSPAVDILQQPSSIGHFDVWRSRVKNLPEFGGELPAVTLADEILTDGDGQIKAMLTVAGNPVLSVPNGGKLDPALESLDFMVSIDFYVNETTRHADIILPPVHNLLTSHYDLIFHTLAVRNTANYSKPLFKKNPGSKFDWEIYLDLAYRISKIRKRPINKMMYYMSKMFGPEWLIAAGLKRGSSKLSLNKLKKNPHGIDLGPLQPSFPHRLFTKDKKINLLPKILVGDLKRVQETMANRPSMNGKLTLIGRRQLRSNNSWMHNCDSLMSGRNRFNVLLNHSDAEKRQIQDGQNVRVSSPHFQFDLKAKLTDEMMPGVISIPHGWGHDSDGIQLSTASAQPGGNINNLASGENIDLLTGNADVHLRDIDISLI